MAAERTPIGALWRRLQRHLWANHWRARTAVLSLIGTRDENQDNYLLLADGRAEYLLDGEPHQAVAGHWPARYLRLMVFDGMGGHRDGRQVAEAAVRAAAQIPAQHSEQALRAALQALHQGLAADFFRDGDPGNPGATVVWVEFDLRSGRAWLAQVGDSRVYLLRERRWRCLTHDHTLVEFNWRDGDLDEARYQELSALPGQRLAQALAYGSWGIRYDDQGTKPFQRDRSLRLDLPDDLPVGKAEHADVRALSLRSGDCLLLASDGLWSHAVDGQWWGPEELQVSSDELQALAMQAIARGGRDNVTVVGVHLMDESG
jgi:serine/threonine protein phosphatase PrpC